MNQELITEEVRVQVHHQPACRIEMHVKTVPQMVKEARKKGIKAVSKEISIPGFRKGHAPDEMVLKKFPSDVEKQLHKELADLAFAAAQKIAKVPLLNHNAPISFDLKSQSLEEGAELVFSFETEPVVPTVDPAGFVRKPVEKAEVGEKQVEEAIRQMRFFYAEWKAIEGRPIQDGDYIMINLDTLEGEEFKQVFHHVRFEVSKERMADWMKKLVSGAQAGDVLEGMSEDEEKEGLKPKKVRVAILKVEEAVLPEPDDEFAKKVGAADALQMRESVKRMLTRQADEKADSQIREQVNDYLVQTYPFELPKSLIEAETKHRFNQLLHDSKFKANWDKMTQDERKAVIATLETESDHAVKLFYLSRQIVRSANLPITEQEVQNEVVATYQSHGGKQGDQIPRELYALALSKVILTKAQTFIMEKA